MTAHSAADLIGIQANTAALFYRKLRQLIADRLACVEHEIFDGVIELDESYFGGARKGKRGRNGIPKSTFPLFLKECEFRFNYGTPKQQFKTIKEWAGI